MELQADCLAGVWANRARENKNIVEPGDFEEALGAASAIGRRPHSEAGAGAAAPFYQLCRCLTRHERCFSQGYSRFWPLIVAGVLVVAVPQ